MFRRIMFVLLSASAALGGACATNHIEGTEISDTKPNREIWDRVMEYRKAVEERDAEHLLAMVSRKYFENGSTTDETVDDYGYDELRERVLADFKDHVVEVQMRIMMRRIDIDGDRAHADYEYFYNFKYTEGGMSGWKPKNDFNRLEFVREDGAWKIAGGL